MLESITKSAASIGSSLRAQPKMKLWLMRRSANAAAQQAYPPRCISTSRGPRNRGSSGRAALRQRIACDRATAQPTNEPPASAPAASSRPG